MKKFLFFFSALLFIGVALTSCGKGDNLAEDDQLIEEIALADSRVAVAPEELPAAALTFINERHFDTYVEEVFLVASRGFECVLGNEERLYFDLAGRVLEFRGRVRPNGPFGPNGPHGPCHNPNFGRWQPVRVINLPACITDYVAANYPDATIHRAKSRAGHFVIGISGPLLLRFDNNCDFVEEFTPVRPCGGQCNEVAEEALPSAVSSYISANYPNAEFVKACERGGRTVVFMLNGEGGRLILGFGPEGNLLFVRG